MKITVIIAIMLFIIFSNDCVLLAQEQGQQVNSNLFNQKIIEIQKRINSFEEKIERTLDNQNKILEKLKTLKVRISRRRGRRAGV